MDKTSSARRIATGVDNRGIKECDEKHELVQITLGFDIGTQS